MRTGFTSFPLFLTIFLSLVCILASADPIELHARREVERRQHFDNSSIPATTSSSKVVIPTTSQQQTTTTSPSETPTTTPTTTPPTSPSSSSSLAHETTFSETSSETAPSSTSYYTSFSKSVSTYTTDYVTTIDGVATTVPTVMASTTLIPTLVPSLQNTAGTTGLSNNSKKIVIGVVVGVGGAAVLALIAVIIWRHMRKENEAKPNMSNVPYFSDEDPTQGYGQAPTENVVGTSSQGDYRPPGINAAANF